MRVEVHSSKQQNFARLPQKIKTKQFCETSDKNRPWGAKLMRPCKADGPEPVRFVIFSSHLSKVLRMPLKKWNQVMRSSVPVTQNNLSKPEDPTLQNATFPRKSAPWLPNMSDGGVSCIASAKQNASLQIHACQRFWNGYKTLTFGSLLAASIAVAMKNDSWTVERVKKFWTCGVLTFWLRNSLRTTVAVTFWATHFQKCSEHALLWTFWLRNVLRATAACSSTAQLPKVLRTWGVFNILTSTCALRHSRALFKQLNFQKCSGLQCSKRA